MRSILLCTTVIAATVSTAQAEVAVMASIKPIHSLVAAVMDGVGTPGLIVEGAGSPHTYSLKPSQAEALQEAKLIFWVGHEMEAFLEKPIGSIGADAKAISLIDAPGLVRLPFREGGAFDSHDDHVEKAGHDHDHDHVKEAAADDHGHDDDAFDGHIWLDPINAKVMVQEIEAALVEADPTNAARYQANAEALEVRLGALVADIQAEVDPVKDKGFIVFHDAYQYFEKRFGIIASGSITVSPETLPGARRVGEIRDKVRDLGANCVFAEPQFEPKLVSVVMEGSSAKSGMLDPLGASLNQGSELYFELIRNLSTSLADCLGGSS